MTSNRATASGPALAVLLGCLAGCGPSRPDTSDPAQGLEVLKATLEAWQRGQPASSLKDHQLAIHASDPAWEGGARLVRFEIAESEVKNVGFDLRAPVRLWLSESGRDTGPRRVVYSVTTTPRRVVVRDAMAGG